MAARRAVPPRLTHARDALDRVADRSAAVAIACALFPLVGGKFHVDLATKIMIFAIFALSLELLVGETGLVSFGHAAFFGIGAYATRAAVAEDRRRVARCGCCRRRWWSPRSCAALIGALSLRTRGVYFIMVTLAFSQMAYYVFHDTRDRRRQRRHLPQRQAGAAVRRRPRERAHVLLRDVRAAGRHVRACSRVDQALALRARARRHPRQRTADARRGLFDLRATSSRRSSSPARWPASRACCGRRRTASSIRKSCRGISRAPCC